MSDKLTAADMMAMAERTARLPVSYPIRETLVVQSTVPTMPCSMPPAQRF